ncbi:FadR/GntR family transcriptional regulator [Planctomycetota bacterium]
MKHGTSTEQGVNLLLNKIRNGKLQPGDKLPPEPELASQLGLSRATLRQVLKTLQTAGLIEARPRIGTILKKSNPSAVAPLFFAHLDLADISEHEAAEARVSFEPGIAGLAAQYRTDEDLEKMDEILEHGKEAGTDWAGIIKTEREFHSNIVAASHNLILQSFNKILSLYFDRRTPPKHGTVSAKDADKALKTHISIYKAIKNKESAQAETLMKTHLQKVT